MDKQEDSVYSWILNVNCKLKYSKTKESFHDLSNSPLEQASIDSDLDSNLLAKILSDFVVIS